MQLTDINAQKGLENEDTKTKSKRLNSLTKVPMVNRQGISNTAECSTKNLISENIDCLFNVSNELKAMPNNERIKLNTKLNDISQNVNITTPKNINDPIFKRSNTRTHLKKPSVTEHDTKSGINSNSERKYEDNLQRANSQISLLKHELMVKNNELTKLKKLEKLKQKCKTPHNFDTISPNNKGSTRRAQLKSRAKTGNTIKIPNYEEKLDASNSHSDEYYETTKISPTSSFNSSIYSKGIPQIKSSQSCRNTNQETNEKKLQNK